MALVKVATVEEIDPGTGSVVTADGKEIALFNLGGTYYAIDNTCKHLGGPLGEGDLEAEIVTCPLARLGVQCQDGRLSNGRDDLRRDLSRPGAGKPMSWLRFDVFGSP